MGCEALRSSLVYGAVCLVYMCTWVHVCVGSELKPGDLNVKQLFAKIHLTNLKFRQLVDCYNYFTVIIKNSF